MLPNKNFVDEQKNISSIATGRTTNNSPFEIVGSEKIIDFLKKENISIIFTREYEHLLEILRINDDNEIRIDSFSMPHPSGIAINNNKKLIYTISTRTPHILYCFKQLKKGARNIILPFKTYILPGNLYGHELFYSEFQNQLILNATGFNEIISLKEDENGIKKKLLYRPNIFQERKQNCMQLNSYTENNSKFYYTCFSYKNSEYKPWKDINGPHELGQLIRVNEGKEETLVDKLTCPHSARKVGNKIFYCNSGNGELRQYDLKTKKDETLTTLNGFTRGLLVMDSFLAVGISKILPNRTKYAPKVNPADSFCGLVFLSRNNFEEIGRIIWPTGMQIFDIQSLSHEVFKNPELPKSRLDSSDSPSEDFYEDFDLS